MKDCRDAEVLAALQRSLASRGRMPTTKELCFELSIERSQLARNLARLVRCGELVRVPSGTLKFTIAERG